MDQFDLIETYFKKEMSPEQLREFETRIIADKDFAGEVAFYLSTLVAAKDDKDEDTRERFRKIYEERGQVPAGRSVLRTWWPYMAAAAAIAGILFSVFLFNNKDLPQQLSAQYIKENLQTLSVRMDGNNDPMQEGLDLYNQEKFPEALRQFQTIISKDTANYFAKENAGITCLRMKNYDQAIDYFKQLQTYTTLRANPGEFYLAITLMERNASGDRQKARELLQQIVSKNEEGSQTAQQWLTKL